MKTESSNTQTSLGKLATTLIVTALCSQFPMIGFIFFAAFDLSGSMGGDQDGLFLIPALAFLLIGPSLMGLYLERDKHGLFSGFLGLISMVAVIFAGYFLNLLDIKIINYLFLGLSAGFGIAVILLVGKIVKLRREIIGLGLGIAFGIAISVGLTMIINANRLYDYLYSLPFLWVWLSTVFFPELFSRRTDWRGALVYILLMVIATSIIYFVYPH
jgi:hypothetical protein